MRMTFDEFCNTFSNIKYLGYDDFLDHKYYFQVDDPRNNYRKLVYYFEYETKQYNPLYDEYEPYDSDEGKVGRYRLRDYSANWSGFDYQEFKNITKNYKFIIVCDDKGNKLQVENLQDNEIFYVNGDKFILTNGRVKNYIIGLNSDYFKPKRIPDSVLNNLK